MAFRSTSVLAGANGTSAAVPVPTGSAIGDIAVVGIYLESTAAITPPSGFTQKSALTTSAAARGSLTVFWKRLTAADTGTYSFSWTGSAWRAAAAGLWSGRVSSGDPFDGTVGTAESTTSVATLNVSTSPTTASGDAVGMWTNFTGGNAWTPPTGYTERQDADVITLDSLDAVASGSTGNVSATANVSGFLKAFLGVLKVASGGTDLNLSDRPIGIAAGTNADAIAIGVALANAAFGARLPATTDTLAIGVALSDANAGSARLGDNFGEVAVNSVVVSDPNVGGMRLAGGTDSLAVGVALTDPAAGSTRLASTTGSLATGVVLLDVITPMRAGITTDTAGIGIALSDSAPGGLRAGTVAGETATVALSLADPSVGGTRLGGNATALTSGLVLADAAASVRLGGKAETLSYAVVLTDTAAAVRLGRTVDTFSIGGGTAFICQDLSGTVSVDAYAGSSTTDAYAGTAVAVAYDGTVSILSYGGIATNCGR